LSPSSGRTDRGSDGLSQTMPPKQDSKKGAWLDAGGRKRKEGKGKPEEALNPIYIPETKRKQSTREKQLAGGAVN